MSNQDITSFRGCIEILKKWNEIIEITEEVDPIYEIAGIQKACEGGLGLLFTNIKGYPGVRCAGNVYWKEEIISRLFDVPDPKQMKFRCLHAMKNPIPPKLVKDAPCQEVVITKEIDVIGTIPIIKHTEEDAGRILGGGNTLLYGEYFEGGSHISFNRMHFRGKDWSSIMALLGTHLGDVVLQTHRTAEKIPITINIGVGPAVSLVAGAGKIHTIVPPGSDELGFAGALQGCPVEIVKAKTVDAYSIANAEWVIEGYIDPRERVWESEEAEKLGEIGVTPFFPEWTGYLGRAYKIEKFHATAITHRKDKPIFFTPLAHSLEADYIAAPFREACFYELAQRVAPGLVIDVNTIKGVAAWSGHVIFKVKKKRSRDEGLQRNVLMAALGSAHALRLAIIVDEDIDIYSADDILWALNTRVNPKRDIIIGGGGGMGHIFMPAEREEKNVFVFEGGMGIDATVPFKVKELYSRPKYPVHLIDLKKWISEDVIATMKARQPAYAKVLAQKGW